MQPELISAEIFATLINDEEIVLIDCRPSVQFVNGFILGSLSTPLQDKFAAEFISALKPDTQVALICLPQETALCTEWLNDIGIQHIKGILEGGYTQWELFNGRKKDMIIEIEPDELAMDLPHDDALLAVDVRTPLEYADGHISGAFNLPLNDMKDPAGIAMLPESANLYLYCSNGTRSIIAASVLKSHGIHELRVISGNWETIRNTEGIDIEKDGTTLN